MSTKQGTFHWTPRCVAATGETFNGLVEKYGSHVNSTRFFKDIQFSADGTTVISLNEDQAIRTFVLPPQLLNGDQQPHELNAHSTFNSATTIQTYTAFPGFDLQDPATTLVLCASSDVPLSLRNALHYGTVHATYPWIHPTTEAYLAAKSLLFAGNGTHFIAGSVNKVGFFDVTRDGEGPVTSLQLKYGRRSSLRQSSTMIHNAIVSALSRSGDGLLAVGTTQREVGIYDGEGQGQCASVFSVPTQDEAASSRGTGVTSLAWSPCARYLLVAERQSDSIHVYDIRNTQQRCAVLAERRAMTPQRLGIDVIPTADGYEVWAGGTDGCVRMWSNPGSSEGLCEADVAMKMHDSAVSGTIWHPSCSVLATCSGERSWPDIDNPDAPPRTTNSMKVWTLGDP